MKLVEKLQSIMGKLPGLIEAGKKRQRLDSWDAYQQDGARKDYNASFSGIFWNQNTFTPRHNIQPTDASHMFYFHNNTLLGEKELEKLPEPYDLVEHLEELGITLDFSKATNMTYAFRHARITHVGTIDLSGCGGAVPMETGEIRTDENGNQVRMYEWWGWEKYWGCFGGSNIQTIDKLILPACPQPPFSKNFFPSTLVNIGAFEGYHIHRPIYLGHAPNVTHDTLLRIINAMHDVTGDVFYNGGDPEYNYYKLTLHPDSYARLTAEEIAIATGKGWIVLAVELEEETDETENTEATAETAEVDAEEEHEPPATEHEPDAETDTAPEMETETSTEPETDAAETASAPDTATEAEE